jgi:hypothetical protein
MVVGKWKMSRSEGLSVVALIEFGEKDGERMVAPVGFEPTTNGLCVLLRLSPPEKIQFVVWTISSHYVSAV